MKVKELKRFLVFFLFIDVIRDETLEKPSLSEFDQHVVDVCLVTTHLDRKLFGM